MLLEIRFFQKTLRILKGGSFGAGLQDPSVKEAGEDAVQIIPERMALCDLPANFIKSQFIIYFLKEKVACIVFIDVVFA